MIDNDSSEIDSYRQQFWIHRLEDCSRVEETFVDFRRCHFSKDALHLAIFFSATFHCWRAHLHSFEQIEGLHLILQCQRLLEATPVLKVFWSLFFSAANQSLFKLNFEVSLKTHFNYLKPHKLQQSSLNLNLSSRLCCAF